MTRVEVFSLTKGKKKLKGGKILRNSFFPAESKELGKEKVLFARKTEGIEGDETNTKKGNENKKTNV